MKKLFMTLVSFIIVAAMLATSVKACNAGSSNKLRMKNTCVSNYEEDSDNNHSEYNEDNNSNVPEDNENSDDNVPEDNDFNNDDSPFAAPIDFEPEDNPYNDIKFTKAKNFTEFSTLYMELVYNYTDYEDVRVIVKTSNLEIGDYTPCEIINVLNYYVVQFDNEDDAYEFEYYENCKNEVIRAETDTYYKYSASIEKPGRETSASYYTNGHNSWGVSYTGADDLASRLINSGNNDMVVVAVIDTGVDLDHPYIENSLYTYGYDFIDADNYADDEFGHGTHVAGTILDCTEGLNVKILPIRVLDENGNGESFPISLGVRYAVENGAKVINLSLSGGGQSYFEEDAIRFAISNGVTVCVSAGNECDDTAYYHPACMTDDGCIVVAAIDENGERAGFSNYGESVDVAAPGVDIYSCYNDGQYTTLDGTSMATPHVSAFAAMLVLMHPDYTPEQIENLMKDSATDAGAYGYDYYYGAGIINMSAAY